MENNNNVLEFDYMTELLRYFFLFFLLACQLFKIITSDVRHQASSLADMLISDAKKIANKKID